MIVVSKFIKNMIYNYFFILENEYSQFNYNAENIFSNNHTSINTREVIENYNVFI